MKCLSDAHWVTGLHAVFLSPDGEVLCAYPRRMEHPFCSLLQRRSHAGQACLHCRWMQGNMTARDLGSTPCPAMLTPLVHDLRVEEQRIGQFALCSYRDARFGLEDCRKAWIRLAREGVAISWNEWKAGWDATPTLNENQVVSLHRWLRLAVQELMRELDADPRLHGREPTLPGLVHRVCAVVREQYSHALRLNDIARDCGVSAEHLSRVFHQSTGLRFRDYLAEVRLTDASRQLMESNANIAEIAASVGHNSLSRFNRAFKDYTGMTPSAWRRRARIRLSNRSPLNPSDGAGSDLSNPVSE